MNKIAIASFRYAKVRRSVESGKTNDENLIEIDRKRQLYALIHTS